MGIAVLATLAFSHSTLGQKTYALGVGGGAAIPVAKLNKVQKAGYNGIVVLAIGVADLPIGVRFDGIYNTFPHRTAPVGGSTSSDLRVIGGLANLIYAFSGATAKSYIIFGAGLYNTKVDTPGAKSGNNVGFNAGLGVTFGIGPFATFFESRYHSISRTVANGGVMQFVPISVGLMF